MSEETDPASLADQGEREGDKLEERSKKLADEVEEVSQDWHRKRSDEGVPGAPPHAESEEDSEDSDDEDSDDETESDKEEESEDEDSDEDENDSEDDEEKSEHDDS